MHLQEHLPTSYHLMVTMLCWSVVVLVNDAIRVSELHEEITQNLDCLIDHHSSMVRPLYWAMKCNGTATDAREMNDCVGTTLKVVKTVGVLHQNKEQQHLTVEACNK